MFAVPEDALAPPELLQIERELDGRGVAEDVAWPGFLQAWEEAVAGWLARFAELDLVALIARPGYVRSTRTHLDLFFRHDQADIRIRRAGIDINPGWTPWLGRVITFHYTADPSAGEA